MDALGEGTRILCSPNAARSNAAKHPKRSPGDDQAHEGNPAEVDAPEAVERIVAGRWVEPIQALPAPRPISSSSNSTVRHPSPMQRCSLWPGKIAKVSDADVGPAWSPDGLRLTGATLLDLGDDAAWLVVLPASCALAK
jgi:hypothetical protein